MNARPDGWLNTELRRASEEVQRLPEHLGGKGNRWAWFTDIELATLRLGLISIDAVWENDRQAQMFGQINAENERRAGGRS